MGREGRGREGERQEGKGRGGERGDGRKEEDRERRRGEGRRGDRRKGEKSYVPVIPMTQLSQERQVCRGYGVTSYSSNRSNKGLTTVLWVRSLRLHYQSAMRLTTSNSSASI